MPIVRESASNYFTDTGSGSATEVDEEHNIPAGTTLSLLVWQCRAHIGLSEGPSWNGSEDFDFITAVGNTARGDNPRTEIWGIVNPTDDTTADIDYTMDTSNDYHAHHLINYSGTVSSSVAAAVNVLNTDANDWPTTSTTGVHASAGTTGRTLFLAGGHASISADPMTNDGSFDEIFEGDAADTTFGIAFYICDKVGGAPDAVTISYSGGADQNGSILLEIIPAADPIPNKIIQVKRSIQRASNW